MIVFVITSKKKEKTKKISKLERNPNIEVKIKKFEEILEKPKIFPKYQKSKKKKKIHYLARASLKFSKKKKLAFHVKKRKFQKILQVLIILQSPSVEDPNVPKISTKACAISKTMS